jgi:hypothetical protein
MFQELPSFKYFVSFELGQAYCCFVYITLVQFSFLLSSSSLVERDCGTYSGNLHWQPAITRQYLEANKPYPLRVAKPIVCCGGVRWIFTVRRVTSACSFQVVNPLTDPLDSRSVPVCNRSCRTVSSRNLRNITLHLINKFTLYITPMAIQISSLSLEIYPFTLKRKFYFETIFSFSYHRCLKYKSGPCTWTKTLLWDTAVLFSFFNKWSAQFWKFFRVQ